ncbi:MAG: alpha/beta hydrolase [Deltaproteobacteria bacterium]|nr:alpha/beta hydrolase [Deltaproteobacteria bacterium]
MILQTLKKAGIGFEAGFKDFKTNRPTLLMIHGAGGSAQVWRNQIHPLKVSLNTLAIDLPGHGKTAGKAQNTIDGYAHWLMETLEAFPAPPFLMGHSMGGAIVQEAAFKRPALMKGIILASTGPRLGVAPDFLEGLLNNFEKTLDTIMAYAYAPEVDPRLVTEGAVLMREAGSAIVHGDFMACNQFDMRDRIAQITLPALILCGEKDQLTPPSLSEKLKMAIAGSRCDIIPSAGHMVMIETPGVFNKSVLDFIQEAER